MGGDEVIRITVTLEELETARDAVSQLDDETRSRLAEVLRKVEDVVRWTTGPGRRAAGVLRDMEEMVHGG